MIQMVSLSLLAAVPSGIVCWYIPAGITGTLRSEPLVITALGWEEIGRGGWTHNANWSQNTEIKNNK